MVVAAAVACNSSFQHRVQSFIGAALAVSIGRGLEQARFVEMITSSTGQFLAIISGKAVLLMQLSYSVGSYTP